MSENNELNKRIQQFNSLSLPGQPLGMHMGTSYLVNDLWREVQRLQRIEAVAREAKNKLDVFMQEVVKADMIVPLWAGILYDELEAALKQSDAS